MGNQESKTFDQPIAGFWRRSFAFLTDYLLICGVSLAFVIPFYDFFVRLGQYGDLVGAVIVFLYFAVFEISGQSLGKKLLRVRVVNPQGKTLDVKNHLLRTFLMAAPIGLVGALSYVPSFPYFANLGLIVMSGVVLAAYGISIYLFVFNVRTRQTLYDLLTKSFVVNDLDVVELGQLTVSRRHVYVSLFLCLLFVGNIGLGVFQLNNVDVEKSPLDNFTDLLEEDPDIFSAGAAVVVQTEGHIGREGKSVKEFTRVKFVFDVPYKKVTDEEFIRRIVNTSALALAGAEGVEDIHFTFVSNFSLGLLRWSVDKEFAVPFDQIRSAIDKAQPAE